MAAAVNCLETEAIWKRVLSVQSASGAVPVVPPAAAIRSVGAPLEQDGAAEGV